MTEFGTINAWSRKFGLPAGALHTLLRGVPHLTGKNRNRAGWTVLLFTRNQVQRAIDGQTPEPAPPPPSHLLIADHWGFCVAYGS
jgi:hypothetical protein